MEDGPGRPAPTPTAPDGLLARLASRTGVLLVVGVCALLLSGVLVYVTVRDTAGSADPPRADVETERVVSRRGGFALAAPAEMDLTRKRRTIRLTTGDRDLVVNVGPGEAGPLAVAHTRFLGTLKEGYRRFELLATERTEVDGRPAATSSGRAVNADKVRIRFVVVTVKAKPRNYEIVAFAPQRSDPAQVLPLVNAVANGFEVLR